MTKSPMNFMLVMALPPLQSVAVAQNLHGGPGGWVLKPGVVAARQLKLRGAKRGGGGFAAAKAKMEAAEERGGRVVVDLPQRADDAARAGGEEGARHARHPLD